MENNTDKYYVSSNGTITKIKDLETTHLINSIAKKQRELFNVESEEDYQTQLNVIKDLQEELTNRFTKFEKERLSSK